MFDGGAFQTTRKYMSAKPESFPFVEKQTGIVLITNYVNSIIDKHQHMHFTYNNIFV